MDLTRLKNLLDAERWRNFNPYHVVRPLLFRIDPEKAHELTIDFLRRGLLPKIKADTDKVLHVQIGTMQFPNPVGLAAGFDKNAEVINEILDLGFGFTEIGSITPRPQPGNPAPRVFRGPESGAVINRFGFNSDGMEVVRRRVIAWYDGQVKKDRRIIGINLGKNKDTTDAIADYIEGIQTFGPYASYLTINISSPNTAGLRDLQSREALTELLQKIMATHSAGSFKPPLFVKIAPDQTDQQLEDIAEIALSSGIHGLIVGNTTTARPEILSPDFAKETGGLSGKPLFEPSTEILRRLYRMTEGRLPLIGCGGVFSAEDAYTKILAGASLIQLYTGMVYEGPFIARTINRQLAILLKKDGFTSISQAVGLGAR